MKTLFYLSGQASWFLSLAARLMIGAMIVIVVGDVAFRNLGLRPLSWAINASEFLLLFVTFLSMPWLIRQKGHVFVEFLRVALPAKGKLILEKLVYLGCLVLCLYIGAVALMSLVDAVARGTYEMRTFDTPKWVIFLPMVLAYGLSAVEWLRYLVGADSLYDRNILEVGGH